MKEFRFACPHCGKRLLYDPRLAGRRIACPRCGKLMVLPLPEEGKERQA